MILLLDIVPYFVIMKLFVNKGNKTKIFTHSKDLKLVCSSNLPCVILFEQGKQRNGPYRPTHI